MPSPTLSSIGKPVTLHMRDGRRVHGTLQDVEGRLYVLHQSSGVRRYDRLDVDILQVREKI